MNQKRTVCGPVTPGGNNFDRSSGLDSWSMFTLRGTSMNVNMIRGWNILAEASTRSTGRPLLETHETNWQYTEWLCPQSMYRARRDVSRTDLVLSTPKCGQILIHLLPFVCRRVTYSVHVIMFFFLKLTLTLRVRCLERNIVWCYYTMFVKPFWVYLVRVC